MDVQALERVAAQARESLDAALAKFKHAADVERGIRTEKEALEKERCDACAMCLCGCACLALCPALSLSLYLSFYLCLCVYVGMSGCAGDQLSVQAAEVEQGIRTVKEALEKARCAACTRVAYAVCASVSLALSLSMCVYEGMTGWVGG